MSIEVQLRAEKESVARFLAGILGPSTESTAKVARRLELELADQIRFDHRDLDAVSLQATWSALPPIAETAGLLPSKPAAADDLAALASSSYAFRLLVLAHVLHELQGRDEPAFLAVVQGFGLGLKEVEAYRDDFVRV